MKIAYAYRRATFYPYKGGESWALPDGSVLPPYLKEVNQIGFDGIELGFESFGGLDATEGGARELQKTLQEAGAPCVALRAGGGLCQPNVAAHSRKRLEKAVQIAGWIGAEIVNTALGSPPRDRPLDTGPTGTPSSHGSSALATEEDYVRTAKVLRQVGEVAGTSGVNITIEVHQHSIADNSWSTLHLLDLANSPYVFANPDLGNVYWTYDVPEETSEEAIAALAYRSKYWHCKSLYRVYIPESERSYFIRVPLPDGDIDYRFAISAMVEAGYDGYLAIEGAKTGDQLYKDRRSVEYVKRVLSEVEAGVPVTIR